MNENADNEEAGWSPPGTFDGFRLVRRLGGGAMGDVYLAHDTVLDRPVAIKFTRRLEPDETARARFFIEARAIARVQHPNVAGVYRVGQLGQRPYLATEYACGTPLNEIAKPVGHELALKIALGLARGLAAAHRNGVLHRDIKPHNAVVDDDGKVKLLDFGLAKLTDAPAQAVPREHQASAVHPSPLVALTTAEDTSGSMSVTVPTGGAHPDGPLHEALTHAGAILGTPHYLAPELWRGFPASPRSDVYALGVLLYELCAGRRPHHDKRILPEIQNAALHTEVIPLAQAAPGVDGVLAGIVDRCLERDPQRRFVSGEELREALEALAPQGPAPSVPEGNPYRRLLPFEAEHGLLFFGRAEEVARVLERLRREPMVIVVGDSGVGKSSLCRAGVLPHLTSLEGHGSHVTVIPGRRPLSALWAALSGSKTPSIAQLAREMDSEAFAQHPMRLLRAVSAGLVIFIDQLEELVTISDPLEARLFSELLAHVCAERVPHVRLLATVRADFLGRLGSLGELGEWIGRSIELLRPLSPAGLRAAIVGPANVKGVHFESDALVEEIAHSAAGAGGALALLQFALAELWETRDQTRHVITQAALAEMGGVDGALARHADSVLERMPPRSRNAAREVLLKLVTAEGTRIGRTERELVGTDPHARMACELLLRGRLLHARDAAEEGLIEIAHEALIRAWPTLGAWLRGDAESRVVRERLGLAAAEWRRVGKDRDALWGDRQLADARGIDPKLLSGEEAQFLDASAKAMRRARILRLATVAFVPMLLGVLYGGGRLVAARDLEAKVDAYLASADKGFEQARSAAGLVERWRASAFAEFDAGLGDCGERVWQEALVATNDAEALYARVAQDLEAALALDPRGKETRARFGDVLYERALLAEHTHREALLGELLPRLAIYDEDGTRRKRWNAPGYVTLATEPPGVRARIFRYVASADGHFDVSEERTAPASHIELAQGSYLFVLERKGHVDVRYPLVMGRAERIDVRIALPRDDEVPPGFVYIPGGRFLFGSADEALRWWYGAVPLHPRTTGSYLMAEQETTMREWLAFMESLPSEERERRMPHTSGRGDLFRGGGLEVTRTLQGPFRIRMQPTTRLYEATSGEKIAYEARQRRALQDWMQFPVGAISYDDARAYVAWLGATGRVPGARLCTEVEWERAARGADARRFPHGNRLHPEDSSHDATYGKEVLAFGPDEVGSHPASSSPFGVEDLAGSVWEWTSSGPEHHAGSAPFAVLRGGSWYQRAEASATMNRELPEASHRDQTVGLRTCADAPPPR